jgi:alpha-glucosidase
MAQRSNAGPSEVAWWQRGVVYQIYLRSFMDASGDGVGDLRGIVSRLDYLQWLGVDAVWISPFYPSPMADFGYDVSDYTGVDPLFGTLSDFDRLLEEAHRRGIRVILDYVPNHTSDEHPWFVASRSSRENPKRDWYLWRDPAPDGAPPNNWQSIFGGGSAWEWDEGTGQYYLHAFDVKQPDLNWRNPEVREAMYGALRCWLDRGVDGFRIDVLHGLIKDDLFRDNPENPDWREGDPPWERQIRLYSEDQPEMLEILREMRAVADSYGGERVLIGELYLPLERMISYYGPDLDGVHLPFNFGLILLEEWEAPRQATDRGVRGGAARGSLAQLGPRPPRRIPHSQPRRRAPRATGADAPAHAARHAHPLLRGRDRHARCGDTARVGARSAGDKEPRLRPRPRPHPDAVGRGP